MIVLTIKTTTDKLLLSFLSVLFVAPITLLAVLISPVVFFCCGLKEFERNLLDILKFPLFPLACFLSVLVPESSCRLRIGNASGMAGGEYE